MEATAPTTIDTFWKAAPFVTAAGLGLGLGARGLRQGVDMLRYGNTEGTPVDVEQMPSASTEFPVNVSPEEAAELRRSGVKVKRKGGHKVAAVELTPGVTSEMGFFNSIPTGALGAGALVGGWKLGDMGVNALRMHFAKAKKKQVEDRIAHLLKGNPADEDLALGANMKAAEDAYFMKKEALSLPGQDYASALGLLLGGGGTLAALSAYNTVSAQNKYKEKAKALRAYLRNQSARPAFAAMQPVETAPQPAAPVLPPVTG